MTKTHQAPNPEDGQEPAMAAIDYPCDSIAKRDENGPAPAFVGSSVRCLPEDRATESLPLNAASTGSGGRFLYALVSGLQGDERRDAEIDRLRDDGWERASEPGPMYGSVWVAREEPAP